MTIETLINESLKLKPSEKFRLANVILESVDIGHPDIDKLWGEEAERRLKAYDKGTIGAVSLDELLNTFK